LWIIASLGFDWYADHVGEYQKTYGAIGGVIVVLLWLYASGVAILIGAELNAAIEDAAAGGHAPGSTMALEPPRQRTSAA
jgi:membrane protein